ncbi:LysR family transcriptional regulator [Nannocystis sp. SCPEA4]|uniref:LysR family transcriptional regulator n=1 Tax=Nannocystis sp. SCPEA4 TaxID=2996787 RepID=UPI00226F893F|nr:LysR family transcriptional regulator [Nannocystis sp. SCPEA4]MCY1059539.1 LysR family transcriptional regulator [Nannocystis sp. SCPEA4]
MTPFDDLTLLRDFVQIVESGSISAAARTLKVPQPSLSRHLRALEDSCGTALLRRDTHGMCLTEAGHRLLADARVMLALADEAAQRLHAEQAALHGHLRLFATIDFGQFTVSRLIGRFLQAHPGVTAELGYTNRPATMIQEGYDAGVVVGELTDDSVVARPAGKVVRYVVAAPQLLTRQPAAHGPEDLRSWPWLALAGAQFGGSRSVTLTAPKLKPQTIAIAPVMVSEGVTSLREAARAGVGVVVLPDWLAREDLVAGRLVRVLPQWNAPELPVHVIYPGQRHLPARVRAFVEFAVAYMTTEMHTNR